VFVLFVQFNAFAVEHEMKHVDNLRRVYDRLLVARGEGASEREAVNDLRADFERQKAQWHEDLVRRREQIDKQRTPGNKMLMEIHRLLQ
jgi:hypothetical protein